MASNSEDEDDAIIDKMTKDLEKLSMKGKMKFFNTNVDKCVSPEDDIDKLKLSKETARCLRLQVELDRLQVEMKTEGTEVKTQLYDIANDLNKYCIVTKAFQAAGDGGAVIGGAMMIGGVISSIVGYDNLGKGMINYGSTVHDVGCITTQSAKICEMGIELWKTYSIQDIIDPYEKKRIEFNSTNAELHGIICSINKQVSTSPVLLKIFGIRKATFPSIKGLYKRDCGWMLTSTTINVAVACIDLYSLKQLFEKGEYSDAATALRKEADKL